MKAAASARIPIETHAAVPACSDHLVDDPIWLDNVYMTSLVFDAEMNKL